MDVNRWSHGDTVVMRYPAEERMVRAYLATTGDVTPNVAGWPHVVLEDVDDRVAIYLPEGTPLWRWNIDEGSFRAPRITLGDSVRLLYPGRRYEVSLFYDTGSGPSPWVRDYFPGVNARFCGWKVDLTSPFIRTRAGFDVFDDVLDIAVFPDGRYYWRDEDEMARLVEIGLYTRGEAAELRRVGETVIAMIERRQPPFDDSWLEWLPGPDLKVGALPDGWQHLPVPAPYKPYQP